jgi:hypothetical protein
VPRSSLKEIQKYSPYVRVVEIDSPHFLLQANATAAAAAIDQFLTVHANPL